MDNASQTSTTKRQDASTDFCVAIIGGGIGGLSTALSLAHHCRGIHISVYEQAPEYKEIGAGIGISVNATRVLYKIGVGAAASSISGERDGIHRSNRRFDNGAEIVTIEAMDDTNDKTIRQLSVHRAEFLELLLQAVKERNAATLYTNKRVIKVKEKGEDEVTIFFNDSTSTTVNLVIGADGIHSVLRSQFAPNDSPRYSEIAYRGLLPMSSISAEWPFNSYAISWVGRDKHFLLFPISRNKTLNVVAFVGKPEEELGDLKESWTSTADRSELAAEYAGWDPTLQKVIGCMDERVGKWRINDRDPLHEWVYLDGKIVLSGDAAHAMLPHQGSGAGHAIEDAYIISLALRDYLKSISSPRGSAPRLSTWMNLYQTLRLPRTQKSQAASRQQGLNLKLRGPDYESLTYDECLPIFRDQMKGRMKWVWSADIISDYEKAVDAAGLR